MGKLDSGPDMLDCGAAIWEIEQLWNISISILIVPDGSYGGGGFYVHALTHDKKPASIYEQSGVGATVRFPTREHATLAGAVLELVMRVDDLLTEAVPKQVVKKS